MEMSESSGHEVDHAEMDDGFARFGRAFVVFAVSPVASQPGERAFDDPALGQGDKPFDRDRSQHRLQHPAEGVANPLGQTIAAIRRVRKKHLKAAESCLQPDQGQSSSIVILPVGAVNDDGEHQPQGIDHQVPLASVDLFPCIVAPLLASLVSANRLAVDYLLSAHTTASGG